MRKSEVFLQMVATQHPDRHWSRDLQVWVYLLPPPPRCGQGPPGTPWRVCHPTAARESVHQEGVGMIECQHLGKLWWILLFGHSLCKRGIFLLQIWALRSQPCWSPFTSDVFDICHISQSYLRRHTYRKLGTTLQLSQPCLCELQTSI